MYLLDIGPVEQSIARQAYKAGEPLPDRIANAPELRQGLQLYLEAFFELDSERSHNMGLRRIPWSSIKDYAVAFDFDDEQRENLFYHIRAMDRANLERLDANQKK